MFVFPLLVSVCKLPPLAADVIASPLQEAYHLGDSVSLSCPQGRSLDGEATATCDSSLNFSPDPAQTRCIQGIVVPLFYLISAYNCCPGSSSVKALWALCDEKATIKENSYQGSNRVCQKACGDSMVK